MNLESQDSAGLLQRVLDHASQNLTIERVLIRLGLDPTNISFDAILERVLDIALANITPANLLALVGGIFLIATFVVRTMVPLRVLCIISSVFFLAAAVLSGSIHLFLLYFLALPISVLRLVQIRNLVKKARSAAQGDISLDWLRPFMTPREHKKGDVLFRKGDPATEMFLTVSGKFLVTEINIEIPPGRMLGELGFLSPNNHRTQSVECIEDGEVMTIAYDKLLEVYFQKPEFGYYFLRLASDRLLQNFARLEAIIEQDRAAQAAADPAKNAIPPDPSAVGGAGANGKKPLRLSFRELRTIVADRRQKAIAAMSGRAAGDSSSPSASAEIKAAAARRRMRARAIVERHANVSALGGVIPLPVANVAAVTAVIVRMVKALSELYGVPFERNRARALVVGLMGGVMPTGLATAATSIVTFVPGVNLIGLAVSSVIASAAARKIGEMLIEHFETGVAMEFDRRAAQGARSWRDVLRLRRSRMPDLPPAPIPLVPPKIRGMVGKRLPRLARRRR